MKNTKEIIIGIFAVIGVLALVTGFANNTETATQQVSYGTPESHVWVAQKGVGKILWLYNKKTGDVRRHSETSNLYRYITIIEEQQDLINKE